MLVSVMAADAVAGVKAAIAHAARARSVTLDLALIYVTLEQLGHCVHRAVEVGLREAADAGRGRACVAMGGDGAATRVPVPRPDQRVDHRVREARLRLLGVAGGHALVEALDVGFPSPGLEHAPVDGEARGGEGVDA